MSPKAHAQSVWTLGKLKQRSIDNQNPEKWNQELLRRDVDNQNKNVYADLPITKTAFPVADYDYYLTSNPFTISTDEYFVSGISVGENTEEGKKYYHFSIFILSDKNAVRNDSDLVVSRNYPYFTAEGFFEINKKRFDWLTAASPDGFSMAFVNMKLFDLRFGKTVFIVPQQDGSFQYLQLEIDANKYSDLELFKKEVMQNPEVKKILESQNKK